MNYVKVESGVVVNIAVFDEPMPDDWPDRDLWFGSDEAQIGWKYKSGAFTAPSEPPDPEVPAEE